MKKKILVILMATMTTTTLSLAKETQNDFMPKLDYLTGDTKLACEALLCLSTGNPPSECNSALKRYYSIDAKKLKDLIKKRQAFLNLCPKE